MSISDILGKATSQLREAGIESARLDCMILLEDVVGKDRGWILAHTEYELSEAQMSTLETGLARRVHHEPLAYIRSKIEFYGREFYVDQHVLIPRPETESFIGLLKSTLLNTKYTHILDLGSGSGCIGITLALEIPRLVVTLADVDKTTLKVARRNAALLGAEVTYKQTDLLSTITEQYDVIVTNLPYVPDSYPTTTIAFEPKQALFAGKDGLDLYRAFWRQVDDKVTKPKVIATESLLSQHSAQTKLALRAGYQISDTDSLVQLFIAQEV